MDGKSTNAEEGHLGRNGRLALLSFGLVCGAAAPAAAVDVAVPPVSVPPVSVPPVTVPELLPGVTLPPIGVPSVEVPPVTVLPEPVVIGPITLDPVTTPAISTPAFTVPTDGSRPEPVATPAPAATSLPVATPPARPAPARPAPDATSNRDGAVIGPAPDPVPGTKTETLEPASVSGVLTERDRGFFAQFGHEAARIAPWFVLIALTIAARLVAASAWRDATNGRSRSARRASSASHPAARA